MPTPEERLKELGLNLPPYVKPLAKYKPALRVGDMLYLSGHLPVQDDGTFIKGKVGVELTTEQGYAAARQCGLAVLASAKAALGSLGVIRRIVKTMGLVNCPTDFVDHPKVINGFSELMAEVFGEEAGVGTRAAFGAGSLPGNAAVEIECVFEVG
jgi:enamine deaminase RidA (YjgF/YER057c/UK114 family)